MCGISGELRFFDGGCVERRTLHAMTERMRHRGPDGGGVWTAGCIGLGARRLSIIDVAGGAQPMANESGSVRVVFNGEIYNHRELRAELLAKGHRFRSECDTEVVVHLYEELGAAFLDRLNGMFAVAVWDADRRSLTLARDRLGIKPLFYFVSSSSIVFASELHALLLHPGVPREVDPRALHLYMNHEFVPAPRTMIDGVKKLLPAEVLTVSGNGSLNRRLYWRCRYQPKSELDEADAAEALAERLARAVRRQLVSDVPLGAFLSGGIDSSSLVYWMREHGAQPIRTFSVGFADPAYDELPYARQVARLLGTDHHEAIVGPPSPSLIEQVASHLDEPLGDTSAIPTYVVSKLSKEHVTVCLSGDGSDELLAGYHRHLAARIARQWYEPLPAAVRRRAIEPLAARLSPRGTRTAANAVQRFVGGAAKDPRLMQLRWQTFLPEPWLPRLYSPAMLHQAAALDPSEAVTERLAGSDAIEPLDRELAVEQGLYLPDDILCKLDRMSMAVSLEARVPFLDHELVEFAASLPSRLKLRFGRGKHILRRAMKDRLPRTTLERGKRGFSVPMATWLRGDLYALVADVFAGRAVGDCPWLAGPGLTAMLEAHRSGAGDHSHPLWSLFVLAHWLERVSRAPSVAATIGGTVSSP